MVQATVRGAFFGHRCLYSTQLPTHCATQILKGSNHKLVLRFAHDDRTDTLLDASRSLCERVAS